MSGLHYRPEQQGLHGLQVQQVPQHRYDHGSDAGDKFLLLDI
jgi:hypothetical protein